MMTAAPRLNFSSAFARTLLLCVLVAEAVASTGCDANSYPTGIGWLVEDLSYQLVDQPYGTTTIRVTQRADDSPQLLGYVGATGVFNVTWPDGETNCDPLYLPPGQPLEDFTVRTQGCRQTYDTGRNAGFDLVAVVARNLGTVQGQLALFPTGMAPPTGTGTEKESVFRYTYSYYGVGWLGALRWKCPNRDCRGKNFPIVFPSMHLPMDENANVMGVVVDLVRYTNGKQAIVGSAAATVVAPDPDLIVVPVHAHYYDKTTSLADRKRIADEFAVKYDAVGVAKTALAGEKVTASLVPGGNDPSRDTEYAFRECKVQFRLASVQFHDPAPVSVAGGVILNCGDCNQPSCGKVLTNTQPAVNFQTWSKLGASLRSFATHVPAGTHQGIQVVAVDGIRDSKGAVPGEGYGCKAGVDPETQPPYAVVTKANPLLQMHEMAHVLGLSEVVIMDKDDTGFGLNAGFSPEHCIVVRNEAKRLLGRAP